MQYRENSRNGDKLSILGFGCMRFPKDENEIQRLIDYAIDNGVNYFDTAYIYSNSEAILGRCLAKNGKRKDIKIATKLPHFLINKYEQLDKIFNEELSRLQTDYIDYYFIHMITDLGIWTRLVNMGILDWISEKKKNGQIRNIGFSYHGGKDEFIKLIDAYDWEFCMIQYNFFDEHTQAGRTGLEYAHSKNIPVMIMEPLKGGTLVNGLPKEVYNVWNNAYVKRSPAEWALRWLWNHNEVTLLLSGMSNFEVVEENIKVANNSFANSFIDDDYKLFAKVNEVLKEKIKIPCTGCNYCMPCPAGVNIPVCFQAYNNREVVGNYSAQVKYITQYTLTKKPSNAGKCTKCGKCEKHCPQKIEIRKELSNVKRKLEGFYYKPISFLVKKFMLKK